MSKVAYTVVKSGDQNIIKLSGRIDEDFRHKDINISGMNKIIFNFKEITMINSCGVREWISFLKSIPESVELAYEECTPIVVTQMNIIAGFLLPRMKVVSFYAPYFNPSDDSEVLHLITEKDLASGLPPVVKDKTGEKLEFDAHPDKYFNFLKNLKS
jgi:anti-anti-sigma regulatory factor